MIEDKKVSLFDKFLDDRSSLIYKYSEGHISKTEFLKGNFLKVKEINIKPFKKVDSFKKGMYNYQYYNVVAKYYGMKARESKENRNLNDYDYYRDMRNRYYHEKDKATLDLLEYLDFENIKAYYVNMESEFLDGQLYEIILLDFDEAIFHSKSYWLLKILQKKGVFLKEKKKSVIDEYINEEY